MKLKDREKVIEFYNDVVWLSGMPKSEILTDKDLNNLKDTMWFAKWMLVTSYNDCVNSIKNTIKRLLNGA